jgi:hypothetical protein
MTPRISYTRPMRQGSSVRLTLALSTSLLWAFPSVAGPGAGSPPSNPVSNPAPNVSNPVAQTEPAVVEPCAAGIHSQSPSAVHQIVTETAVALENELNQRCSSDEACSEKTLSLAAKAAVQQVSKKHGWIVRNKWVRRIGASTIVAVGGTASFGIAHLVAQAIPGNYGGAVYGVWAFLNLELIREASSIETEWITGAVRQWFWGIKNGLQSMSMDMPARPFQRIRYENSNSGLNWLEHQGRSITNNADMATAVRWLAAHQALRDYLEANSEVRLQSLARIFASAIPPVWLTYSADFLPEDPSLVLGAQQMLADYAQENGIDLRPLLTERILNILKPNELQKPFYEQFIQACLSPTQSAPQ